MTHEIIVDIILAVIALIGTIMCQILKQNGKARLALQIINEVAPAAVIAAEKLGGAGNVKFAKAVNFVQHALDHAGITSADVTVIENAVEAQWAELSQTGALAQYKKEVPSENEKVNS
ncbi:holin [Lactobacillus delbrueckii subsp. lactis]|uniref:Holin n=1 Tax=Lactobacillus delbrueckii subsp. lactis TaxID=29397 RepID=A0A3G6K9Q6_LACDL|nr:phage holin, LLH family [Lactobacillus delbrueckii]YP_007002991.1 holin [Lactobacillus phage JCL1032]ACB72569.1 putative holin [Lactobacillus phage JCL1032]AZA15994.1 MAG: holin [Lactobacillus delbrueckii subsp. lactis]AZA25440.1 MAG: holin [Lactobacillus delbrueckii subsp. lactis]MCD5576468.1 holin [Lactobacillus delbrueckii subsp. lactis]MCD5589836.1 holin [Lactobacillus delbrueckii subsp. lactis]